MMGQAPIQTTKLEGCYVSLSTSHLGKGVFSYFLKDMLLFQSGVEEFPCLLSPYSPQSHAIVVLVRQLRGRASIGSDNCMETVLIPQPAEGSV
jgi:hypothetical protein